MSAMDAQMRSGIASEAIDQMVTYQTLGSLLGSLR